VRKALALIRANWLTALSYRLETFFSVVGLFLAVIPLYFVSRALQPLMSDVIQSQAPEYFGFLIIGGLTLSYVRTSITALHGALGGEISTGSFEALLGTPTGLLTLLAGMVGQAFSMIVVRTGVAFVFALAFGLHVVWSGAPAALLALTLIVLAYLPFGIMAAALVLAFRTTGPFPNGLIGISTLLGGVYYPTEVIPSWIQSVSFLVPLTYGLRALRRSFLDGAPLAASAYDLSVLAVTAAVLMAVSLVMFSWSLGYARRTGTLAQY
jgi:ABC-2 type transport system permease protein